MTTSTPSVPLFPAALPAPSSERWWLEHKTQIFQSPLSGQEQRLALNAARWRADITFPYLKGEEARTLLAFCARMQGAQKRFRYSPAHNRAASWGNGSTPQVADPQQDATHGIDANLVASSKLTLNLVDNLTDHRIRQGDSFSLFSALGECSFHIVTTPPALSAQGAQFATIRIAPSLMFAPTNDSEIELRNPQACMRLLNDQQARLQWLPGNIVDAITLQLVEVL